MSAAVSPVTRRRCSLAVVCRTWRVSRATVYWRRALPREASRCRPGPSGPMPDPALLAAICAVLGDSPFHGEGHSKVRARLRLRGVRTYKCRVLRLMRENNLLAPSRLGAPRGTRSHHGTIIPEAVDTIWGTDLTTTITNEGPVAGFVAVDHCSAERVGIRADRHATPLPCARADPSGSAAPVRRLRQGHRPRLDRGARPRLPIQAGRAFQGELRFLGMDSSPAFVSAPEGNGCAERFIRTLKENLLWMTAFSTIEELRLGLLEFRQTHNTT